MCQVMNVLTFASSGPSFFCSLANSYLSLKTQIMHSLVQALPFLAAFPVFQRSFWSPRNDPWLPASECLTWMGLMWAEASQLRRLHARPPAC